MRAGIQGLGWLVRRTADPQGLGAFYRDVVGLPVLRTHGATTVFWCGETVVMGINEGGRPQRRYRDRSEAPFMPVFRVRSMERATTMLRERGVEFVNDPFPIGGGEGILAYFRDPGGHITGLQERNEVSGRPKDLEWRRRRDSGELAVHGAPDLDGEIEGLGWIVVRCTDLPRQVAFYRDILGFDLLMQGERAALLDIGGTMTLEVALGCPPEPLPPIAVRSRTPSCCVSTTPRRWGPSSRRSACAASARPTAPRTVGAPSTTTWTPRTTSPASRPAPQRAHAWRTSRPDAAGRSGPS